jgi:ABC-type lipoprotein export system ATPase subunit
MSDPIVVCESLVKIFKSSDLEVFALQGLDLVVQRGELMGIVGASGSGKTTLMNVLGGLTRPSAGRVVVNGQNLLKLSDSALEKYRRSEVGFIWQLGARNLIPYLSARENVELPMILAGVSKPRPRAEKLLEVVGLSGRHAHHIQQLSGGEQQRVAIAVSLANNPSILLADEPTGELDTVTAQSIYDAFRAFNHEMGVTILIVSHDPNIAKQVNRVMAIRDGKAAAEMVRKQSMDAPLAEDHFEELTVMDSAGRLQIPKTYRDKLAMGGRVRLELMEDGVVVRAAGERPLVHASEPEAEKRAVEPFWSRWMRYFKKSQIR